MRVEDVGRRGPGRPPSRRDRVVLVGEKIGRSASSTGRMLTSGAVMRAAARLGREAVDDLDPGQRPQDRRRGDDLPRARPATEHDPLARPSPASRPRSAARPAARRPSRRPSASRSGPRSPRPARTRPCASRAGRGRSGSRRVGTARASRRRRNRGGSVLPMTTIVLAESSGAKPYAAQNAAVSARAGSHGEQLVRRRRARASCPSSQARVPSGSWSSIDARAYDAARGGVTIRAATIGRR